MIKRISNFLLGRVTLSYREVAALNAMRRNLGHQVFYDRNAASDFVNGLADPNKFKLLKSINMIAGAK